MNIKALITTFVLGSSSVAVAAPQVRDHRTHTTVVTPPPPVQRPAVQHRLAGRLDARFGVRPRPQLLTWVTLANNMAISGRSQIELRPSQRQFTKLELRAQGKGRTSIDKVIITFGNGRTQVVDLDAKLNKKRPSLSIDLNGDSRRIDRVVLVGKSNGRASVDVLAI